MLKIINFIMEHLNMFTYIFCFTVLPIIIYLMVASYFYNKFDNIGFALIISSTVILFAYLNILGTVIIKKVDKINKKIDKL